MKRKLLFFIFVLTALSALYINTAFAADIKYVYEERTELTKGVSLTSYNIFMSDRNWNKAYVVEADLNYPHLSLEVLTGAGGVNYLSTVPDMAKNNDTTAAINSDFFSTSVAHAVPCTVIYPSIRLSFPAIETAGLGPVCPLKNTARL